MKLDTSPPKQSAADFTILAQYTETEDPRLAPGLVLNSQP